MGSDARTKLIGSLLSSRAPDRFIRPVITFVILASGLKYVGVGTTQLGWILCLVLLAAGAYWLLRESRKDRTAPAPAAQQAPGQAEGQADAAEGQLEAGRKSQLSQDARISP